jgi:hypothetical protein
MVWPEITQVLRFGGRTGEKNENLVAEFGIGLAIGILLFTKLAKEVTQRCLVVFDLLANPTASLTRNGSGI